MTVTELAELSSLSKSYISQVKHGKCPPSKRLLGTLTELNRPTQKHDKNYFDLFIKSRESMGVRPKTLIYYNDRLSKFIRAVDYLRATRKDIEHHLNTIPANKYSLATHHASFRAIKTFYRWLEAEYVSLPRH